MKHQYNCKCQRCSMGEIEYKKWELEQMKIYNFIVHMVIDDCDCPLHANFHTHGLLEKFNHLDIQICFPLDQQIVMGIIHDCVKQIKKALNLNPAKNILTLYTNMMLNLFTQKRMVEQLLGYLFVIKMVVIVALLQNNLK